VEQLRKRLASISDSVRDMRELRWNDQPISGPDMLGQIADTWLATDEAVLKAAAVLHAIGPTAETDVRSLQSDYEAARVQAVTLVRDLILADVRSSAPAAAEQRYVAYLAVIPGFMTALHATPDNALAATAALNQLAGKSPELESKVRAYRAATAEAFRWRRRIAARYLQKFHEQSPSEQLAALIDHPPARAGEPSGPPVLPGQQPPPTQRRMTQMAWTIDQAPDSVATLWTEHWKGTPARHSSLAVRWSPTGDPIFISSWHSRVVAEIECSRQTLLDCIGRLTKDLLLASNHPPITLEAAIALHTAVHGPYAELGGRLRGAVVENLPDRLFDMHDSGDVVGALAPGTLAAYPTMPALIRLQFEPDWFMHDLFAEFTGTPPATAEPAPPSAPPQSPPVASQVSPPKAPTAPGAAPPLPPGTSSPPSVSAPESTSAGASNAPKATIKKEPATKPPEGGFRF
jgi:hypothetical protein